MTTDHQPDSPTGVDALTTGDLGRPLAEFLRPRLAPQVAAEACTLTDEVLCAPDKPMEPEPKRYAAMRHLPVLPTGQGHGAGWGSARGGQGCRGCRWPARPLW